MACSLFLTKLLVTLATESDLTSSVVICVVFRSLIRLNRRNGIRVRPIDHLRHGSPKLTCLQDVAMLLPVLIRFQFLTDIICGGKVSTDKAVNDFAQSKLTSVVRQCIELYRRMRKSRLHACVPVSDRSSRIRESVSATRRRLAHLRKHGCVDAADRLVDQAG